MRSGNQWIQCLKTEYWGAKHYLLQFKTDIKWWKSMLSSYQSSQVYLGIMFWSLQCHTYNTRKLQIFDLWTLKNDLNWLLNNNWINAKYHQMALRLPSDGALISPNQPSFGIPGQTKVSGDRQRETTHEICCLAAELHVTYLKYWCGIVY